MLPLRIGRGLRYLEHRRGLPNQSARRSSNDGETMCGIAGYSLSPDSGVDRTLAAQALLAAIAERGADAVGYAYRAPGETTRPSSSSARRPRSCSSASRCRAGDPAARPRPRLHQGPPVDRRQQPPRPPRAGRRDPQRDHRQRRRAARAAFLRARRAADDRRLRGDLRDRRALTERRAGALEELRGSMAAVWLDEREPDLIFAARGVGRPLWLGEGRAGVFFASTRSRSRWPSTTAASGCASASCPRARRSPCEPARWSAASASGRTPSPSRSLSRR